MSKLKAKDIALLFDRPLEPLFTAKQNGKVAFELPQEYYTDRYRPIGISLSSRLGEEVTRTVPLSPIQNIPNLEFAKSVRRRGTFSLFNRSHQEIAGQLIKIFIDAANIDEFFTLIAYVKDRVNIYLYQVSLFAIILRFI